MSTTFSAKLGHFFKHSLGPLLLILICPPFVLVLWYTLTQLDGSLLNLGHLMLQQGALTTIWSIWQPYLTGTHMGWAIVLSFMALQLLLMRVVPGKKFLGPITPKGNVPEYRANGMACFLSTLFLFYLCAYPLHLFSPTIIYDNFAGILGTLNLFSLIFCVFLYLKGRFYPSSNDISLTGNFIFDYYNGVELYPRVLGWNIKMFTNCRFGMMSWVLIIWSFAAKQQALFGLSNSMWISVAIMTVYVAKFFWWETGYLRSLDIMHDRAGFYICWGCLVWVPAVYTSPILYLVNHPINLAWPIATFILIAGISCVFMNYFADRQRQKVRATNGECLVWGKKPLLIHAEYKTSEGEVKQSILLASGFWGVSRHFHYLPEIGGAFFWTVSAGFTHLLPYFYVIFLTILLLHRAFRDDERCRVKYQQYWTEYCRLVPNKIIPRWRKRASTL